MNKRLIVLIGDYGSGKTTFAKKYAKEAGAVYLDFDVISYVEGVYDCQQMIMKLGGLLRNMRQDVFIMDGVSGVLAFSNILQDEIGCKISYWVCFASPDVVQRRQKRKRHIKDKLPRSISEIREITHHCALVAVAKDSDAKFIDTENNRLYSYREWLPYWQELCFTAGRQNLYQDIELKQIIKVGLSESYKTWERLSSVCDFKGKSVLEFGSNLGYFLFKAEEAGAVDLLGVDISATAIADAYNIGALRGSKVAFRVMDIADYKVGKQYDCVLCLNLIHHLENRDGALEKVFGAGDEVVFELPRPMNEMVRKYASNHGYYDQFVMNSHRLDRVIIGFNREVKKKKEIRPKYSYNEWHYRKQCIRKQVFHWIGIAGLVLRKLHLMRMN